MNSRLVQSGMAEAWASGLVTKDRRATRFVDRRSCLRLAPNTAHSRTFIRPWRQLLRLRHTSDAKLISNPHFDTPASPAMAPTGLSFWWAFHSLARQPLRCKSLLGDSALPPITHDADPPKVQQGLAQPARTDA